MTLSTVVLRNESSASGTQHLSARIDENGDLRIDGQDLGSGVGQFWGEGASEYEWCLTVQAAEIPRVIVALGGAKGDDVLALLAARFTEDELCATEEFFEEQKIPTEFFSRVGD